MIQMTHLLVLSQPGFVRRQVGGALATPRKRRWWRGMLAGGRRGS